MIETLQVENRFTPAGFTQVRNQI